jgi:hypothetical protein
MYLKDIQEKKLGTNVYPDLDLALAVTFSKGAK